MHNFFMLLIATNLVLCQYQTTECELQQILTQGECEQNLKYIWDQTKKVCIEKTTTPDTIQKDTKYCDQYSKENCRSQQSCAWTQDSCQSFTSCTVYASITSADCQAINTSCISDGTHCVPIDECSTYQTAISCTQNKNKHLCFWNNTDKICSDADTCDKLPQSFTLDAQCRDALSHCTISQKGGCEDSGAQCSDHTQESQCVWNSDKSIACYWNQKCLDRTCENASTSILTENDCISFRSDGTCTTKRGGGCRQRTTCSEAEINLSCVKNAQGKDCFWNGTSCVDKICENALTSLKTNEACSGYLQGCITKQNGGCVANGPCSAATIEEACKINSSGGQCFWENTKQQCMDKICQNAPISNDTHDKCTTFLFSCTVKSGGGCQDRICSNAPNSVDTNQACEEYLPNIAEIGKYFLENKNLKIFTDFNYNKCITKKDGGCIINSQCSNIKVDKACEKDISGKLCFWDPLLNLCKEKTCLNASTSNTDHDSCQQFLPTCTVNATFNGCVEKTCESSLKQDICDKDLNGNICIWKTNCFKKLCSYAPQTITTNEDCQIYNTECILDNKGKGCANIVSLCDDIKIEKACQFKLSIINGVKKQEVCVWKNSQCNEKSCSTAPTTIQTTEQCLNYFPDCVANNPVNGVIKGCQDLPKTCNLRSSIQNCEIARKNFPECIWDQSNNQCKEKSCLTANITGGKGSISTFTFETCKSYLNTCIPNLSLPTPDGCMAQPTSCRELNLNNCQDGASVSGNCYWKTSTCVEKQCENLGLNTHDQCHNVLNTCTVAQDLQNCMKLATECSSYKKQEQCKFTSDKSLCSWRIDKCVNIQCSDADNSQSYNTDQKCSEYLTKTDKCTVVDRVNNLGCIDKSPLCSDYTSDKQCYSTNTGQECIWATGKCLKKSDFAVGECSTFKGTKSDCEKYRLECSNQVSALVTDNCILDCTKKTGSGLTLEICASINSQCSLSSGKNQCVSIKSSCSDYKSSTDCYKSTQSYCFYSNGSCIQITSATDCQKVNSGVLSDSICKLYNSACTINQAGTSCQERKAVCTNYGTTQADCSISTKGNCIWKDSTCIGIVKPAGSDMCQMKFGAIGSLTHSSCQDFNLGCTRNQDGSRCQFQDTVCSNYTKQSQCSRASTDKYCLWKNNACIKPTDITTECQLFSSLSISEVGCGNLLTDCINLMDNSGCQPIKTDCSGYQSENACNKISSIQCFWNSSCKSYASTADCELIRKNKLTNEDCLLFSNNNCVIGDGKCQIKSATCADYSTQQSCTYSTEDKCMWLNNICFAISYPQICEAVTTKGSKSYCEKQNSKCTVNIEGFCQLRQAKCSDYQSSAKCSFSDEGRCYWNTACTLLPSSKDSCSQVTGYNLRHDVCHSFHPECTEDSSLSKCKLNPRCKVAEANYDIDGKKCLRISLPDSTLTSLKISKLQCEDLALSGGYSHSICNQMGQDCTANKSKTKCITMKSECQDYGEECADATKAWKYCYIENNVCTQITSKSQCSQFTDKDITDQQCTSVLNGCVPNVSRTQCQEQKQKCTEYLTKEACTKSVETYWCVFSQLSSTCIDSPPCPQLANHLESLWDCPKYGCTTLDGQCGNKGECSGYTSGCSAAINSSDKKCYPKDGACGYLTDCSLLNGYQGGFEACRKYSVIANCVTSTGGSCINAKACNQYTSEDTCTFDSTYYQLCYWNSGSCYPISSSSECSKISGALRSYCNNYSWRKCVENYYGCIAAKQCYEYQSPNDCYFYNDSNNYARKCYWVASDNACHAVGQTNCKLVTGTQLTHEQCQEYSSYCTANKNGTQCQKLGDWCWYDYKDEASCSVAIEGGCIWSGGCSKISQCSDINGKSNLTDSTCQLYGSNCTVNKARTACQDKQNNCSDYGTDETKCSYSKNDNLCYFSNGQCINIVASTCNLLATQNSLEACQSYNTSCTWKSDDNTCLQMTSQCNQNKQNTCYASQGGVCFYRSAYCFSLPEDQCSLIPTTNLTRKICSSYKPCQLNKIGDKCVYKAATCSYYSTQSTCERESNEGMCVWDVSCVKISKASHCSQIFLEACTDPACNNNILRMKTQNAICVGIYNLCATNASTTACQEMKSTCDEYGTDKNSCTYATEGICYFDNAGNKCTHTLTDCTIIVENNPSNNVCSLYDGCVVNSTRTACQNIQAKCSNYIESQCSVATEGNCIWFENECQKFIPQPVKSDCSNAIGSKLSHTNCQSYSQDCTSNYSGSNCIFYQETCDKYLDSDECSQAKNGKCIFIAPNCKAILSSTDCSLVVDNTNTLTHEICQSYNIKCTVNRQKSACTEFKIACSSYSIQNCVQSYNGLCYSQSNACYEASQATNCDNIELGAGRASHESCKGIKSICTKSTDNSKCASRTCENYIDTVFNHLNCNLWLNTCTVNKDKNGCIMMPNNCDSQTSSCIWSALGDCFQQGTKCVLRTCNLAAEDANFDNDTKCSTFLQTCTVAKTGGCKPRVNCDQYLESKKCISDNSGNKCFWNPTQQKCVLLKCENIEATNLYNSHDKCFAIDTLQLKCTVKSQNGVIAMGCQSRAACSTYIKEQCYKDNNDKICEWNTNLANPICSTKSCSTAPKSITTKQGCKDYYSEPQVECTVAATLDSGIVSLGGCQNITSCSNYIHQDQCLFDNKGNQCGWNGFKCDVKSCLTAPATSDYDDDQKCKNYFDNTCTVSESGQGCVVIPDGCESMTEKQCLKNKKGDLCYWDGTQCITRSCENAPDSLSSSDQCNSYLQGCTREDVTKCKTKACEEFEFSSNDECRQAMPKCTSNGVNCVERGFCSQASKAGCVTSKYNEICDWVEQQGNSKAYCAVKSCSTAPISYTTDTQCSQYLSNCTTKSGGGCIIKSTCQNTKISAACITALDGTKCSWDSQLNQCTLQDCYDFTGTSHSMCKNIKPTCTVGLNGKCAKMQNCESTTLKAACVEGLNGPCLWINQYINFDGTKGACFQYSSCSSISWTTHAECQLISSNCTTDGFKCVGLLTCAETNTNGGCIKGIDGLCAQSFPSTNTAGPEICKLFTTCEDIYYSTHDQCNKSNKQCTTDGSNRCMTLGVCSNYKLNQNCFLNDKGQIKENGQVISTGICIWDKTQCRDQTCEDLEGTSHQTCKQQLSKCTSNGQKCIAQDKCSTFQTQSICQNAVGTDGICFWEAASASNNNKALCRVKLCSDISNGQTAAICQQNLSTCISDGNQCIAQSKCSDYKTITGCNYGGLDGICIFTQSVAKDAKIGDGSCALMVSCVSASSSQIACEKAKDKCAWTPKSEQTPSKCSPHTCETYKLTNQVCTNLLNWNKTSQQFCSEINGLCQAVDPATLTYSNCFVTTSYTYTWNAQTNKCELCKKNVVIDNQNNQSQNSTPQSTNIGLLMTFYFSAYMFLT